ncbi:hypothetical protein MBLNU459_g8069t1 [Dothideomycetes sp. NU459]
MIIRRDTFDDSFQKELATESWTLYSIGMLFIILRTYSRIRRNGIRGLSPDDYLIWVAAAFYTMLVVCLNVIAGGGGSNLFEPDQLATFTPEDIRERINGSKIVIVSEQAMLNVIYTLKVCMLFIYSRLTMQLKHQIFVKALACYVACGYVASQLAFFFACRPFSGYWAVPPPDPQCTTLQHYAITQGCFNISADAFMLAISLPLLINTTLPLKQKIVLLVVFGMGTFVILAAILTKVFNLADVYSTVYMLWYVRESSVAVYVTNLPLIWPLMREVFPFLRSFTPGQRAYSSSQNRRGLTGYTNSRPQNTGIGVKTSTHISVTDKGMEMGMSGYRLDKMRRKRGDSDISLDSDERVLNDRHLGGINQETRVDVEEASLSKNSADIGEHGWARQPEDRGYQVQIQAVRHGNQEGAEGSGTQTP